MRGDEGLDKDSTRTDRSKGIDDSHPSRHPSGCEQVVFAWTCVLAGPNPAVSRVRAPPCLPSLPSLPPSPPIHLPRISQDYILEQDLLAMCHGFPCVDACRVVCVSVVARAHEYCCCCCC